MSTIEVYGIAFQSPLMLWPLVPVKKYFPLLLVNESASQIKEDVRLQMKQHDGRRKMPVVLAGSATILQNFLKNFPALECKVFLFDVPGFLTPFFHPLIRWLDCDHQAGGAWQIAKLKPEDFPELLERQRPLSAKGRELLLAIKRHQPSDRVAEIEKFVQNVPKSYKDLLASNEATENRSPLKVAKDGRKSKECFKTVLQTSLELVTKPDTKKALVSLAIEYVTEKVGKRDYLSRLSVITSDDFLKKEFLSVRKWVDSKSGAALREATQDFIANHDRRSWETLLAAHKKVAEEDLLFLVSYLKQHNSLHLPEEKVSSLKNLGGDKTPPKRPNHPELPKISDIFNF